MWYGNKFRLSLLFTSGQATIKGNEKRDGVVVRVDESHTVTDLNAATTRPTRSTRQSVRATASDLKIRELIAIRS